MNTVAILPYVDNLHREQVMALWCEVFAYEDAHNRPELAIDKKIAVGDELFFVAVKGTTVIGTTMAGYDGHRGWIYSVAVALEYRRAGIGTQLIAHAEQALIGKGCVKINLQILPGNESVMDFYAELGYVVEQRINMGKRIAENTGAA